MKWNDRIGRRLKLHDLHILLTVADLGSMSKAAEHLAISQPSISKAIADIERTVGVRLLDRTSKGVECTAYGRALLRRGNGAFDELRQGVKEIESLLEPGRGEVRVGCPEAISAGLMAAAIDRFAGKHPNTTITVVPADNMAPGFTPLRTRQVDFLVGHTPSSLQGDDVETRFLYSDHMYVAVGSQNPLARRRKVELASLIDKQWVWSPSMFDWRLAEAFQERGLAPPKHGVRTYSVHQQLRLIAHSNFIGALAGSLLRFNQGQPAIETLPVDFPSRAWPVGIVTLKDRTISPVAENLMSCIRELTLGIP